MAESLTLYLHFPCFDGVVSAVVASEYLRRKRGWQTGSILPVNYDKGKEWATTPLSKPAAVVDFLYHPEAVFWADHHQTSFSSEAMKVEFESRKSPDLIYDAKASCCAELIWSKAYRSLREPRFREMVAWARRIDSARYASVEEAVLGDAPALRINASLLQDQSEEYCQFLVSSLIENSLSEVAGSRMVSDRYRSARTAIELGQKLFCSASRLDDDGIVVFHVPRRNSRTKVSRYAPYLAYPNARYSVGILPAGTGAKITAMRNPWRNFKSLPLGQIFSRYGGGGHQRVASVLVKSERDAEKTLGAILNELRDPKAALKAEPVGATSGD